ncbi:MAG: carbohydrate-binding domain-containing protein [bacterium]
MGYNRFNIFSLYGLAFILIIAFTISIIKINISQNYLEQKDPTENELKKAINLTPDNAEPYYRLACLLKAKAINPEIWKKEEEKNNLLNQAVEHLTKAISLNPSEAYYYLELAWIYEYLNKDINIIKENFFKAIVNAHNDPFIYYSISVLYFNKWGILNNIQKKEALDTAKKGITLSKNYFSKIISQLWDTTKDYHVVREVIPVNSELHRYLANFLVKKNKWKERGIELAVVEAIEIKEIVKYLKEVESLLKNNEYALAEEAYNAALKLLKKNEGYLEYIQRQYPSTFYSLLYQVDIDEIANNQKALERYQIAFKNYPFKIKKLGCVADMGSNSLDKGDKAQEGEVELEKSFTKKISANQWQGKYKNGRMCSTGKIFASVNLKEGSIGFKITAKGSSGVGIFPYMEVRVDNHLIGEEFVGSSDWREYDFNYYVPSSGDYSLSVAFMNDYYNKKTKEDRNLYVGDVEILQ